MYENYIASFSESFPIPLSCHLLNLLLSAAFQSHQAARKVENFAAGMLCDLCNTTERLLSQSVVHRSCAVSFLLPAIFKAFSSQSSLKISLQGNVYVLSRNGFKKRIWECSKKLSSVGSIEAFLLALGRTEQKVMSQKKTLSNLTLGPNTSFGKKSRKA
ncbi:hypothetical protein DY000_02040111 [Brassica cretica]|uniref:Uncharacterized protein n=1 Tax=Brassica cretica TaxID=69181 RepID=A0ABQ7B5F2_BRACR|nr:hypothetical protein DY000_02040111 [Brassica cretica]